MRGGRESEEGGNESEEGGSRLHSSILPHNIQSQKYYKPSTETIEKI